VISNRARRTWAVVTALAVAFFGLAVLVRLDVLGGWDADILQWARPDDGWGPAQIRADHIVQGLRPSRVAPLLAVLTVAFCVGRRSVRPLVLTGGVGAVTAILTLLSKLAVGRPDPHHTADSHGGSFPSGHVISLLVCLGLAVYLVWRDPRWWSWLAPAAGAFSMAAALILTAAHWATDTFGGILLGTAVLVTVSAAGWNQWAHDGSARVALPPRPRRQPLNLPAGIQQSGAAE